jgi:NadR type nicotinamide-nucleotide adenylyltransferase
MEKKSGREQSISYQHKMKKIVIIGPESTGKSTLSSQLAEHYRTVYCPEFAREYLKETKGKYNYQDLLNIAHGQLALEKKLLSQATNGFYFIDTDMYVMKVWCEVAFGQCHSWILKQIASMKYDFYLVCNVDLPWKPDGLREYPDLEFRKKLFLMYRDIVVNSGSMWAEISGTDTQRLQMAVGILDTVFRRK